MSEIQRIKQGMAELASSLKADAIGQIDAALSEVGDGIKMTTDLVGDDCGFAGMLQVVIDKLEECKAELSVAADEIEGWNAFR